MAEDEKSTQNKIISVGGVIFDYSQEGRAKLTFEKTNKIFELEEKSFRVFKKCKRACTDQKGQVNFEDLITKLISTSLINPKLSDTEIDDMATSEVLSLTKAVTTIYKLEIMNDGNFQNG